MSQPNRLAAVFLTTAAVLIATVVVMFGVGRATLALGRSVVRHEAIIRDLDESLSVLKDAETGQRGYLLTGDDTYLGPYSWALSHVDKEMNDLRALARSGELPAAQVDEIDSLVDRKLKELARTIELRRDKGFDQAVGVVRTDVGKRTMEAIRARVESLRTEQQEALDTAQWKSDRATSLRSAVFATAGLVNLGFLAWAYRRLREEAARREAAAAETRRQKDLLATTLTSIGDAVIVTDEQARVTFMNDVAEGLTGWRRGEAAGRPLADVFHIVNEESRQPAESPVDKVLRTGVVVGLANHTVLVRRDGSELPIDDSGAPIRGEDGTVRGVVLVFRDFSEHKRVQRSLQQARADAEAERAGAEAAKASALDAKATAEAAKATAEAAKADALAAKADAEAANAAKDQFLAALSHELRTPLTPVLAMLTNWEADGRLPEPYLQDVTVLRRNVELEARLIDDLLDLNRIIKGKLPLHLEVVDVHQLIDAVLGICRSDVNAKRLEIRLRLDAKRPLVKADSARVQQVLWNVLRNAAKFTPERGRVDVKTENRDGSLVVSVSDNGIGMTPDVLDRLFQPFEQGSADFARRYGGLGIGMALARALLDAQGGKIAASSPGLGGGSTFSISLPVSEAAAGSDRAPSPATAPARPLNILLVEDHADTARTMARLLEKLGHRVRTAGTVAAATEMTRGGEPMDLLVSDIGLPDGTGIDFIRDLRQRSDVPAIALTGFGMEEDVAKCIDAGFTAHLTKPVNFARLELMIRNVATAVPNGEKRADAPSA